MLPLTIGAGPTLPVTVHRSMTAVGRMMRSSTYTPGHLENRWPRASVLSDKRDLALGFFGDHPYALAQAPPISIARSTRRPETPVFHTTIGQHREQPLCHEPEYGIRAE